MTAAEAATATDATATATDATAIGTDPATVVAGPVDATDQPGTTPVETRQAGAAGGLSSKINLLVPYLLAAAFFAVYAVYSVQRHLHLFTGGFDLGLFEQAIRGYAHLRAPVADLRAPGFNLLGDHFHPILILLAPVYRLFPSAVTVLAAQAALIAVSVVPVTRLAIRHAGIFAGVCVGVAYGLSWGLQEGVAFDFHEVCFAVPLLAFSLEQLVLRRWVASVAWAVPLVLVKEDLGLTLAALGAVLFLRRQRRLGLGLAAFGLISTAVEMLVIVPSINPTHSYGFWGHMSDQPSLIAGLFGVVAHLLTPWAKQRTALLVVAPTAFLALRSSIVLVAVPTLLWRFATNNPFYWVDSRHYNLILMPIAFMALVEVLPMLLKHGLLALRIVGRVAPPVTVAIALMISTERPFYGFVDGSVFHRDATADAIRSELKQIPDGATVGASNRLAAQLTSRCTVYLLPDFREAGLRPQWVVVALGGDWPLVAEDQEKEITRLESLGYHEQLRRPGLVMLRW